MNLKIDFGTVEGTVSSIKSSFNSGNIVAEYESLISTLSESKGDQAEAIIDLLIAEKNLADNLKSALLQLADSIQTAANEFKSIDKTSASKMTTIQ